MVKYMYDAWGNCRVLNPDGTENTAPTFIGNRNPFRYRGYYFDTETGLYFLKTRYYDPAIGRFMTLDDFAYLDPDHVNGLNLYAYCNNNPVMFSDPTGHMPEWLIGIGRILTGIGAVVAGVLVIASGVALVPMLIVAGITIVAGILTTVNGAADIQQSITGDNFIRDGIFDGNQTAYDWYAGITEGAAIIGSIVCEGWLNANGPRIQAYKNVESYTQSPSVARHIDRPYNNSVLLQRDIIKYGKMTKDASSTGYIFTAPGTLNGSVEKIWRLLISNVERAIWHFGHGF